MPDSNASSAAGARISRDDDWSRWGAERRSGERLRVRLAGPRPRRDPRITAARGELADIRLAGEIFVPHYAEPVPRSCLAATTPLLAAPGGDARALSELIAGDGFALLEESGGFGWGWSVHDGYVGYVALNALGAAVQPTHAVSARAALFFAEPDIKAPVRDRLPMGARIAARPSGSEAFLESKRGFVHVRHVQPLDDPASDPAGLAVRCLGAPYRWGGRSGDGLDCSGLVQTVLGLCGVAAPRDSDQQAAALGRDLGEDEAPARGDLIFLPGHVAMMVDDGDVVHANAYHMQVTIEPLAAMLARQEQGPAAVVARRTLRP